MCLASMANAATKQATNITLTDYGTCCNAYLPDSYFTNGDFAISFALKGLTKEDRGYNQWDVFTWLPYKGLDVNATATSSDKWSFVYGMITSDWIETEISVPDPLVGTFVFQYDEIDDDRAIFSFSQLSSDGTKLDEIFSKDTSPISYVDSESEISFAGSTDNVSDITVWKGVVEASDLAAVDTPAVPEPTTATLSLLALAGLAARRRRK